MATRNSKKRRVKNSSKKPGQSGPNFTTAAASSPTVDPSLVGLLELKPKPLPNEPIHDVAVFAKSARDSLPEALANEAAAIADALQAISDEDFDQAKEFVRNISRDSPMSDWRLFIRGLIQFYQLDSGASETWGRLDATRRPSRIASVLMQATTLADSKPVEQSTAQVVQQFLERKVLIGQARRLIQSAPKKDDQAFTGAQVKQLISLRNNFRKLDPKFVDEFSRACVYLSIFQGDPSVFLSLKNAIPGPPSDPHWNMLELLHSSTYDDASPIALNAYKSFERDLAAITTYTPELRSAIQSLAAVHAAKYLRNELQQYGDDDNGKIDLEVVLMLLDDAKANYPKNRIAHHEQISVLNEILESDRAHKFSQKEIEGRLHKAKASLVENFPDEIECTLDLIDAYFDEGQLDCIEPLAMQLNARKVDSPLARSLNWKLRMRRAFEACRRKTTLAEARANLQEAESIWPRWLKKDWLPYLKAAIELRAGNTELFEQMLATIHETNKPDVALFDFQLLAALQHMRLTSPALSAYRKKVEAYFERDSLLTFDQRCLIGDFFWDLHRCGLKHSGYRAQAVKVGKPLFFPMRSLNPNDLKPTFFGACNWGAIHNFWASDGYYDTPKWAPPFVCRDPKITVAVLKALSRNRRGLRKGNPEELIGYLREAALTESDEFYRYYYVKVATEAEDIMANDSYHETGRGVFSDLFDLFDDDDDDEDEMDDTDVCMCPECVARRASGADFGIRMSEKEFQAWLNSPLLVNSSLRLLFQKLGPEGIAKVAELNLIDYPERMASFLILCMEHGLKDHEAKDVFRRSTPEEFIAIVTSITDGLVDFDDDDDDEDYDDGDDDDYMLDELDFSQPIPKVPKTAAERRDDLRARNAALNNLKKQKKQKNNRR